MSMHSNDTLLSISNNTLIIHCYQFQVYSFYMLKNMCACPCDINITDVPSVHDFP